MVLGTALDAIAVLTLTVPILLPIALQYDVDPIALGVLMILSQMIGLLTPPVGTVIFVLQAITKAKDGRGLLGLAAVPGAADCCSASRSSSGRTRSSTCPRGWGCDAPREPALLADRPDRPGRRSVADAGDARARGRAPGAALRLQGHRPARRRASTGAASSGCWPARSSSASTASTSPTRSSRRWCRWSTRSPRRSRAIGALEHVLIRDGRDGRAQHRRHRLPPRLRATGCPTPTCDRVVLLGAGGAGTAVAHALADLGVRRLLVVDPDAARAAALARLAARTQATEVEPVPPPTARRGASPAAAGLVNASPVGMAAHPGSPVPAELLRPDLWVADIVYRPLRHRPAARRARAPAAGRSAAPGWPCTRPPTPSS